MNRFFGIVAAAFGAAALAVAWISFEDFRANATVAVLHSQTPNGTDTREVEALIRAVRRERIDAADLAPALAYIRARNDCADFRVITLLRLLYAHERALTPAAKSALKEGLLGFRYGMDEPGADAMVFWSENHQILFAASDYLAGQRYPHDVFADGRTGAAHRDAAKAQILFWLEQRWRFGFSEWNSHYYAEDFAPLANLVDFAQDDAVREKARIVLDLLLLDMASQTFRGEFIATSGRLYENNKMSGDAGIRRVLRRAFDGARTIENDNGIEINFVLSDYETPAVLRAIAHDEEDVVVEASTGRDLHELDADRTLSDSDRRIMAQWGMQAFSNPRAINYSLRTIRARGLIANSYLAPFRALNYRALVFTGAPALISAALDLPTNGTLLSRANLYSFRTRDFAMSTAQAFRPGQFGSQQHIFNVTLDPGVTLFHTHPAVERGEVSPLGGSPGYWTGSGRLPLSCQNGAINLSLYHVPARPGFGLRSEPAFTHLYVPLERFDRVELDGSRLLLRYRGALIAVMAGAPIERVGNSELIQRGLDTFWIVEVSSTRVESFEAFAARIGRSTVRFEGGALSYASGEATLGASHASGCTRDGAPLYIQYARQTSRYARIKRDPEEMTLTHGGDALRLRFNPPLREISR